MSEGLLNMIFHLVIFDDGWWVLGLEPKDQVYQLCLKRWHPMFSMDALSLAWDKELQSKLKKEEKIEVFFPGSDAVQPRFLPTIWRERRHCRRPRHQVTLWDLPSQHRQGQGHNLPHIIAHRCLRLSKRHCRHSACVLEISDFIQRTKQFVRLSKVTWFLPCSRNYLKCVWVL